MACKDWEGCSPEEEKALRLAREAEDKVNKLLADNSRNESMLANEIDSLQLKVNNLTALLCDSCYILSEHNLINGKINTHINEWYIEHLKQDKQRIIFDLTEAIETLSPTKLKQIQDILDTP